MAKDDAHRRKEEAVSEMVSVDTVKEAGRRASSCGLCGSERGLFPTLLPGVTGIVMTVVLCLMSACSSSAPRSFAPADPMPLSEFNYQYLEEILRAYVTEGVVNYPALRKDDRLQLFIWQLDRFNPNMLSSRQQSVAFWINVYNAFAIKGILEGDSPQTALGRYRAFVTHDYYVGGRPISLQGLERDLLIPDFRDPRIHFAVVPPARSAPPLSSELYVPERLDEQLNARTRAFINDPDRNRFDRTRKVAHLSMIFSWYDQEFIAHSGSILKYIAQYVNDPALSRELTTRRYEIQFEEFDWSLNGPPPSPTR
jgi:hypothetical protein